ncbi:hypothetical protein GCM10011371_33210 [Novosphingobium marinum]|nr:hypothetical protein GCM10011371_33210 [Novosphingobium marinum]
MQAVLTFPVWVGRARPGSEPKIRPGRLTIGREVVPFSIFAVGIRSKYFQAALAMIA